MIMVSSSEITRKRVALRLPDYLEAEELAALLAEAEPRQRLYFLLCYRAGLRAFEACKVRHEDIVWRDGQPLHLRLIGKGSKEAMLPLATSIRALLPTFSDPAARGWLFPGRNPDEHISRRMASYWMERVCQRAGIGRRKAHLHALRHSFATHLLRQGVSLIEVRDLMRHTSISTTSIYLHTSPERLQEAVDRLG